MELLCPNCNSFVDRSTQQRLSPVFALGPASTPCNNCGSMLRWHKSIQRKIMIGGLIFKFGLISICIAIVGKIIFSVPHFASVGLVGFILLLVGIFYTRTNSDKVKVELANDA